MTKGMGSHQERMMNTDEWLTPPSIIHMLGPFDLDPCAAPEPRPWLTADIHLTRVDDGLSVSWDGRVWLNPPYGAQASKWLERMVDHGEGTVLIFARTETEMFFRWVWDKADAILFLKGRLRFHYPDGGVSKRNSGAPSCLIAYGSKDAEILEHCGLNGKFIRLKEVEDEPT